MTGHICLRRSLGQAANMTATTFCGPPPNGREVSMDTLIN